MNKKKLFRISRLIYIYIFKNHQNQREDNFIATSSNILQIYLCIIIIKIDIYQYLIVFLKLNNQNHFNVTTKSI